MRKLLFIGSVGRPDQFEGGELTKNKNIIEALKKNGRDPLIIDTYRIKKHPSRWLPFFYKLLSSGNVPILVSTSLGNIFWLFKLMTIFHTKRTVSYIGTGGIFSQRIKGGEFNAKYLKFLHVIMVQGRKMKDELTQAGLSNHDLLFNSKVISYLPDLDSCKNTDNIVRFVFMSRMHREKGVDMILHCCRKLNEMGYASRFSMTFFGGFLDDGQHKAYILPQIDSVPNVQYKGTLNLRRNEGYDELASYDVMLFPSFWHGEGFPGVVIDAMIAGLPLIISDWNFNADYILPDETGVIIPAKNEEALLMQMIDVIENPSKYRRMRKKCQFQAQKYDSSLVLNETLFQKLGV